MKHNPEERNFVQNLPTASIEAGHMDSIGAALYAIWKATGGRMPDEKSPIVEYLPQLVILKTIHSDQDSPDVVHVGAQSLLAQLIPQAADPFHHQPRLEIYPQYRTLVRESYVAASDGEPRYDIIGSEYLLTRQIEWIRTERILLPFTSDAGLRWIYCYSVLRELRPAKGLPDQPNLPENSPSPSDPDRLLMGPVPT